MSEQTNGNEEPIDDLPSRGWLQGSVFKVGDLELFSARNVPTNSSQTESLKSRKVKRREWLLLITHDCDMARDKSPTVEALICEELDLSKEAGQKQLERVGLDDPRSFVVSRQTGIVAESHHRVLIDIRVLKTMEAPSLQVDDTTLLREWLARRYARDANSDRVHDSVIRPLVDRLRQIRQTSHDDFVRYTTLVKYVRFTIVEGETDLQRVALLIVPVDLGNETTEDHVQSLRMVNESLVAALNESKDAECESITIIPFAEIRHIEILRSTGVPLDWASWDDDALRVGEPPTPILDQFT